MKKLYITKWALTKGIIEVDANRLRYKIDKDSYYSGKYCDYAVSQIFYENKDIHDTLDDARIVADTIRLNKIINLQKQIQKLEKMTF